jgi:hypothetical protein
MLGWHCISVTSYMSQQKISQLASNCDVLMELPGGDLEVARV